MKDNLKNLATQLKAQGIELDQIKQEGKSAIMMAYLDQAAWREVAGGLEPGQTNFWKGADFAKNG
jgi:hypothetical protein